jgi:hypothetical protein
MSSEQKNLRLLVYGYWLLVPYFLSLVRAAVFWTPEPATSNEQPGTGF